MPLGVRSVGSGHPAGHDPVGHGGDLLVGEPAPSLGRDHLDDREDAPGQVGAAGRGVVVGEC